MFQSSWRFQACSAWGSTFRRILSTTRSRITAYLSLLAVQGLLGAAATAQPSGAGGPLSDVSVPVSEGSRPVHEHGRTMREGSAGSMRSGPVRQDTAGSMRSGSVGEVSRGAVTSSRPMIGGGAVAEHSAGAVKNELRPSAGERIFDLERALVPVREHLRQAEDAGVVEDAEVGTDRIPRADEQPDGGSVELREETAIEEEVSAGEPLEADGEEPR